MARLALEVVGAIAVYDAAFFAWHATLHSSPDLYKRVHAKHHRCRVQRAPEVGHGTTPQCSERQNQWWKRAIVYVELGGNLEK